MVAALLFVLLHLLSLCFSAYIDGSSDAGLVGWGFAIVTGGDGNDDTDATCVTEMHGPVVTNPDDTAYLGAQTFTNNTAELTALGKTPRNFIAQADTLYPAAEVSSDRTANSLPPVRWVSSHRPATENSQLKSTASIP